MSIIRIPRRLRRPARFVRRNWLPWALGVLIACTGLAIYQLARGPKDPLRPMSTVISTPWIPATVTRWDGLIDEMATKYDLDPNLVAIIMTMESGGYSQAESGAGAIGLMQITPPTAGDIARKYLKQPTDTYDLRDPRTSIEFGAAYLSYLRRIFADPAHDPDGFRTVELIAAGYNGGPGAARKLRDGQGLTSTETVSYSRDASNMWRERNASTSPTYQRWYDRGGKTLVDKATTEAAQNQNK